MLSEKYVGLVITEQVPFQWDDDDDDDDDDDVGFVLDLHAELYSASSMKQLFTDRHVALTHYADSDPTRFCSSSFF